MGHVLLTLARLHAIGIIHRDLKPQNLVVAEGDLLGAQFTCFTSTKVHILTAEELRGSPPPRHRLGISRPRGPAGTQFTCFTSTKVQVLTHLSPAASDGGLH